MSSNISVFTSKLPRQSKSNLRYRTIDSYGFFRKRHKGLKASRVRKFLSQVTIMATMKR